MENILTHAVSKCPFLGELAARNGPEYAKCIALRPCEPVGQQQAATKDSRLRRPVLEELDMLDYLTTFNAFHGQRGICPLQERSPFPSSSTPAEKPSAPRQATQGLTGGVPQLPQRSKGQPCALSSSRPLPSTLPSATTTAAPFATLSLGFGRHLPDFGKMITKALQQQPQPQKPRKPPGRGKPGSKSSRAKKPQSRNPQRATMQQTGTGSGAQQPSGGQCPLRKVLGPMSHVVFNAKGNLQCPAPIVKARAMLASTEPVRLLRPQALPAKLLAVGTTSATVNIPCGAWREHCEKFSGNWFLAVHASIPFIAMLRKAVIMPKYAILFSIATAIAGQTIGSRLERRRLAPLKPASLTTSSAPAPIASVALAQCDALSSSTPGVGHLSSRGTPGDASDRRARASAARGAALEYFTRINEGGDSSSGAVQENEASIASEQAGLAAAAPLTFVHAPSRGAGAGGRCSTQLVRSRPCAGHTASELPALTLVS